MSFISQNLRYLRKKENLSQQAFAEKIGLNRGNIASYEKGLAEPNSTKLLKITKYFQVDLADFINKNLSEESEQIRAPFLRKGGNIKLSREILDKIMEASSHSNDELIPLQVLVENSISLGKILEGFKNYHEFRTAKIPDSMMNDTLKWLIVDYEKTLEIAEDLKNINRQLVQIIVSEMD